MQLVEDDDLEVAKQEGCVRVAEQQRDLLRRGQHDLRRLCALPGADGGRGVAGAGLDPDRQCHLGNRCHEVARDVDRQRLQRRDVERVQAGPGGRRPIAAGQVDEARQEAGERLAGAGRRDQQASSGRPSPVRAAPAGGHAVPSRAWRTRRRTPPAAVMPPLPSRPRHCGLQPFAGAIFVCSVLGRSKSAHTLVALCSRTSTERSTWGLTAIPSPRRTWREEG